MNVFDRISLKIPLHGTGSYKHVIEPSRAERTSGEARY